jgi:hypothetical protein
MEERKARSGDAVFFATSSVLPLRQMFYLSFCGCDVRTTRSDSNE